jgi:DNA-binding transcriptional regulator YdaS (Cro superfamily)
MTPTSRQISENVVVLQLRLGMNNKDLADAIGMGRMSIGHRITGRTEWKAYEVDAVARALGVTPQELMTTIPDFQEWERRRSAAATHPAVRAAGGTSGGPRFLVAPDQDFAGLTPPSRLAKPTSDIMSDRVWLALLLILESALADLLRLCRNGHESPLPHTHTIAHRHTPGSSEFAPPVRLERLTTRNRTAIPRTCRLTTDPQHTADRRPRLAPVPRRAHVQHRRSL